jgi:uncharacterized protein (DUF2336 family)
MPAIMTPLPNLIDEIEDALASRTEDKREAALWRITDLFIEGSDTYHEDHITLFDDVIGRLAATIEKNARAKLSTRLARVANAPFGVIRSLRRASTSAGSPRPRRRTASSICSRSRSAAP